MPLGNNDTENSLNISVQICRLERSFTQFSNKPKKVLVLEGIT
jgi:hypothetical protein